MELKSGSEFHENPFKSRLKTSQKHENTVFVYSKV